MRLVVDTNVFVSAALKQESWPASVVRWIDHRGGLLKSDATERQLLEVFRRPYIAKRIPTGYMDGIRRLLLAAEAIAIAERIALCRDPTDDKFLELAINGRANLIVSGDQDLLVLSRFRDIPIITPATFVRLQPEIALRRKSRHHLAPGASLPLPSARCIVTTSSQRPNFTPTARIVPTM